MTFSLLDGAFSDILNGKIKIFNFFSGDGFWEFAKNKFADLFHHRHEDTDYYDGSGHVQDW